MSAQKVPLGDLMLSRKSTLDPRKSPDDLFELFSIPAFDTGTAEVVQGAQIGSSKQIVQTGDVLLSKIVPHIRRTWAVEQSTGHTALASSEWIIFRGDNFDPGYLRQLLVSERFHQSFMQTVAGIGGSLLRARPALVAEIEIPLPPIEEQRRIAAVLDAADALRAKRRQAVAKLDTLTQAFFIDMFGDPSLKSSQFKIMRLEDVAEGIFDCPHSTPKWTESGLVCLRTSNLGKGTWDWTDTRYVSEMTFELRSKRAELLPDDIVLSREGTIGIAAMVQPGMKLCMGQRLVQVRPDRAMVEPRYLLEALLLLLAPNRIEHVMTGSTARHLNVKELRALRIPVPNQAEQARFASLIATNTVAEGKMLLAEQASATLFASLQQRAFRGEL